MVVNITSLRNLVKRTEVKPQKCSKSDWQFERSDLEKQINEEGNKIKNIKSVRPIMTYALETRAET